MLDINKIKKENLINTKENKNDFLEYLKHNYPQTISDNVPNLNAIMQLLGLNTKAQGYELTFTGKALANALYNTPNTKELKFEKEQSLNFENTKNIIIKGDNLDALKLLKQSYYEKIKMIYIDPPYNTKNDDFIYNDDFRKDYKELLKQTGLLEIDENGVEIESETLRFFNSIKSSKTHSGWLSFMLPRLKLARDLLREDGVIFISIDDNEQANLKILCDEIFGEENFVVSAIHENVKIRKNSAKTFSMSHDSVLIYAKNIDCWERVLLPRTDFSNYKNPDNDPRGLWIAIPIHANHFYNADYKITKPNGVVLEKPKNQSWRLSEENFKRHIEEDRIWWGSGNSYPMIKKFLNEVQNGLVPRSIFYYDETGGNPAGDKNVKELFNGIKVFDNPKPVELVKLMLKISSVSNQNDIILDFFAGSGTTAQAVMELNAEDNGNRKFILVQLDEKIDEKKSKVAYDFCKNELNSQNPVISDITIERVKRAGEKIAKENAGKNLDLGFKVFSMVEKPELMCDDNESLNLINHAKLSPYEKALNLALQDCKTLDSDIKMILKDKIYQCEQSFYVINFDDEVLNFLKNTQNENVYINGFDDINLEIYLNLESFLKERLKVVY
ncbi:site-specific DNA-methyltransferase [Campylobacter peloridis]|uniref:site-specific DNA-methyltransferase n=1 Tax=Campylobacter peloridis TaxID=488546 RepID=UPI001C72FA94|nr:site-specific DNA-methyltransferase [Campylobacter peloridis]MBX2079499.1 site-specific DNA-methyltransferase [Campylobacter peloridis]